MDEWSEWRRFPDPRNGDYLCAPFGPGVYELRNSRTGEAICPGESKNVAFRMSSLIPAPYGRSGRNNALKREYVLKNLADLEYRTIACRSKAEAKHVENRLKSSKQFMFPN